MRKLLVKLKNKTSYFYEIVLIYLKYIFGGSNSFKLPLSTRLKYNLKGFASDEIVLYGFLKGNDPNEYISAKERWLSRGVNGNSRIVLDDKILFYQFFKNELLISDNIFTVNSGKVYDIEGNILNKQEVRGLLEHYKSVFIKPNLAGGGRGIYRIDFINDQWFVDSLNVDFNGVFDRISKSNNFIANPLIEQIGFSSNIFPKTINTIRLVTGFNELKGEVEILDALHRFGTKKSIPVDNANQGGIFSSIDIDTGQLSYATNYENDYLTHHPDSNVKIENEFIPNWEELVKEFTKKSRKYYYLPYLAWDIVNSDDGFKIIEINASTDVTLLQMHGGKKNSNLGEYLKYKKIIKK